MEYGIYCVVRCSVKIELSIKKQFLHLSSQGSGNLDAIQIIKKLGGALEDSYLDEGFLLDKKIGVNQPKRIENAKILIANTPMDTDKIKAILNICYTFL